jgi:hypothetical protein
LHKKLITRTFAVMMMANEMEAITLEVSDESPVTGGGRSLPR